jgi:branched-chain amino acid transport system substrate-binding protein
MEITKAIAKELGLTFASAAYEGGTTDFYPFVTPIVVAKPDLVDVGYASPADAALLTKALRGLGYEGIIFAEGGPSPKDITALVGKEVAEGFYMSGRGTSKEETWTPEKKERVARWEEKHGKGSFRDIYDFYLPACYMLGMAIEKAGTIDNVDKIIEALEEVEYKDPADKSYPIITVAGEKTYGAKRIINMWVCLGHIHDGDFEASTRIPVQPECP